MRDFARGFGYAFEGLGLLRQPELRRYAAVPLLVNVLLFTVAGWYLFSSLGDLVVWVGSVLPDWLDWLALIVWPLAALGFLAIAWFGFTLIANLVGAPFNGVLAERVATLSGHRPSSHPPLWRELVAAPLQELRKYGYFALLAVPALLLFIVPGVNLVAPLAWLVVSAWMLALEYVDYPMGNDGIAFADQRTRLRQRRLLALGFGAGVLLMTLVPILNFLSMPAAVAGATRLWCTEMQSGSPLPAAAH
jgi:CysZ protein